MITSKKGVNDSVVFQNFTIFVFTVDDCSPVFREGINNRVNYEVIGTLTIVEVIVVVVVKLVMVLVELKCTLLL